jgi:hypothetical protein
MNHTILQAITDQAAQTLNPHHTCKHLPTHSLILYKRTPYIIATITLQETNLHISGPGTKVHLIDLNHPNALDQLQQQLKPLEQQTQQDIQHLTHLTGHGPGPQ